MFALTNQFLETRKIFEMQTIYEDFQARLDDGGDRIVCFDVLIIQYMQTMTEIDIHDYVSITDVADSVAQADVVQFLAELEVAVGIELPAVKFLFLAYPGIQIGHLTSAFANEMCYPTKPQA